MLRRRRLPVAASSLVLCGSPLLTACGGGSADGDAPDGTATGTSSTSSTSGSSESSSSSTGAGETSSIPEDEETTEDPYEIDCSRVSREAVDEWTRGGQPASVEETEDGCRVVSSSEAGAVIVEWRWLDVIGSSGDASIVREQRGSPTPITVTDGIAGTRTETDVAPTRKSRVVAWIGAETMFIETTVTLDRSQDLRDMRRMAGQITETYAEKS